MTPHQKLLQKLKGVTDIKVAREIKLGHDMLEFEKRMYMEQPDKRGPLPAAERRSYKETHRKAGVEAEERAERVVRDINRLMDMLDDELVFSATEAAAMLDESVPRAACYLKRMWEQGKLHRRREYIHIEGRVKKQWRWMFSKTPFTFDDCFEEVWG